MVMERYEVFLNRGALSIFSQFSQSEKSAEASADAEPSLKLVPVAPSDRSARTGVIWVVSVNNRNMLFETSDQSIHTATYEAAPRHSRIPR